jgi:uncharacterized protein (TIGR00269 family)
MKNKKCDKCSQKSVISLEYGPHYFCEKHFKQFFEARVRKTVRKYSLFRSKEKLLVALSGGKDSVVVLNIIKRFYEKSNEIEALIIDEGVKGYRNKAIDAAVNNCEKLGIKYKIVSFKKEFGVNNDEIMPILIKNPKLGGTCAFCGAMRRNLINKYAKKGKFDKLITGHNLDDEVQSFIMNVFNNDFDKLLRMGAESGIIKHKGFVKRIKPLYETPEKEIIAYCAFSELEHFSKECCPYSWTAKRNEYREMLNNFENRFPGTLFSILRFFENLKPFIMPDKKKKKDFERQLKKCSNCGEPTEKEICKTCEMLKKLKSKQSTKKKGKKGRRADKKKTCTTTKYKK